ncbi:T9SS type A sorting domain-containing protein [Dyadobacter flavalbus]|uniref:T9SS type A sorting domain-containing protein n=1 Tax=Dyadobacter flavalbus TaxID=2579942 RepID=A0A5M8QW37_9BACT|nr:T9SS type A sorting domain-containing protein [Dyadobacter flavalbus]KAA6440389.1 T9SS type A sorting domain-containing protein [Dyadobacter flavalbus]
MKITFIRKGFFTCVAILSAVVSSIAQTITTGTVSPATICAGSEISVPFTTTGTFAAGTVFTVQLSDAKGAFPATPEELGIGTKSPINVDIPADAPAGTAYKVRVITKSPAVTGKASSNLNINALSAVPDLVSKDDYCVGEKASALIADGTEINWYDEDGNKLAKAPVPSTEKAGETIYFITQTEANKCESPVLKGKITITVHSLPANLLVISDSVCQDSKAKPYTFSTKQAAGNKVNWYTALTGGSNIDAPSISLKTADEFVFYATQETAKGCESAKRTVQRVVVNALPAAPVIEKSVIEYCQFTQAKPLTAKALSKATLSWYETDETGADELKSAPVPSTAEGGTTSYYVAQTLEGCTSNLAKIDVKINTTPKPKTTTYLAYCQNENAPILDATGSVLKWYREANSGEFQGVPFTPFTEKVQDYSFYVTQTGANGCESPKEEIKIHIKPLPSATISGNASIDLGQTASVTLRFTGDGPWIYVLSNGTTDTTNEATHTITVKPSITTTYLVTEVSNDCGKGIPIGSALVTVKVPMISSGNPSVSAVCSGKTFNVPFQQSGEFPAENKFSVQISAVNEDSRFYTIPSVATSNVVTATLPDTTAGGRYFVRVISSAANEDFIVKGNVSAITITANPLPVATLSGTQSILAGQSANLKVITTGNAPWTFTLNDGAKDSLITAAVTPYNFRVSPRTTTFYTITKVTNACGTGKGAGSARIQVDPILGIEPPVSADWVNVYPTIIASQCTVEVSGTISAKGANVEIIDLNGRSRMVKTIRQKTTEMDFSGFPSGLYLLRIRNGNLNTVKRIMKR